MKKTRTITIEPEQYKALLEYSQQSGLTLHEIIVKAFTEWIKASEGETAQI
jgi:hypothetical protein